jgi:uncharacterized protein YecT (DUF1311 family)
MKITPTLFLVTGSLCTNALSQVPTPECNDIPAACLAKENARKLKQANADLTTTIKEVSRNFEKNAAMYPDVVKNWRQSLHRTQAAWIKYREARCNEKYWASAPGSGTGAMGDLCVIELTHERIRELRESYPPLKNK